MNKLLVSCAALVLLVSPALAAETAAPAAVSPMAAVAPVKTPVKEHRGVFEQADADNDGIVTKEEFLAAEEKYFGSVDKNGDGKLTKDEIQAQRQAAREKRTQWRQAHKQADTDKAAPVQK